MHEMSLGKSKVCDAFSALVVKLVHLAFSPRVGLPSFLGKKVHDLAPKSLPDNLKIHKRLLFLSQDNLNSLFSRAEIWFQLKVTVYPCALFLFFSLPF